MVQDLEVKNSTLAIALSAAVPLYIQILKDHGGPSPKDFKRAGKVGELLGEKGDVLLFGGKKKGETAHVFNKVAKAIAIASFVPGGITIFGRTFESKIQESGKGGDIMDKQKTKVLESLKKDLVRIQEQIQKLSTMVALALEKASKLSEE